MFKNQLLQLTISKVVDLKLFWNLQLHYAANGLLFSPQLRTCENECSNCHTYRMCSWQETGASQML